MKMLRLVAATAGAFACGALAQSGPPSVVEMYGTAVPFIDSAETTGATASAPASKPNQLGAAAYTGVNDARRQRLTAGTTNWGFRGYEKLGDDLKLVWQLESGFQIDQNTGPGLGARDSKVGLRSGKWGEVFMGQWDTPYKFISLAINPLRAGYVFDYTPIMGNPGMGVPATTTQFQRIGAKPDASFDRRQGNSVQYWSPNWGGFSFRLMESVDEGRGAAVAGGPVIAPIIKAASVQYDVGTLSIRYAYEEHDDYFGMSQIGGSAGATSANPSSKDTAQKIVVLWRIGGFAHRRRLRDAQVPQQRQRGGPRGRVQAQRLLPAARAELRPPARVWGSSYGQAADGSCQRVGGATCVSERPGRRLLTRSATSTASRSRPKGSSRTTPSRTRSRTASTRCNRRWAPRPRSPPDCRHQGLRRGHAAHLLIGSRGRECDARMTVTGKRRRSHGPSPFFLVAPVAPQAPLRWAPSWSGGRSPP